MGAIPSPVKNDLQLKVITNLFTYFSVSCTMQSTLRAKLAELQNSRRTKQEEEKAKGEEAPQKLDFSLLDHDEFASRSWVEIIDEEEQRQKTASNSANSSAISSPAPTDKAQHSKRTPKEETKEDGQGTAQKLDFSLLDHDEFANRSWVEIIDEEEQKQKKAMVVTASVVPSSAPNKRRRILPNPKEGWSEPRTGWCMDPATLERRDKDLQKMKERPTYKRYLSQIPKFARNKSVHPRTPNKYINHTRRSWDKQVRLWKLAIYEWAGETPTSSVCGSRCPSECSESAGEESPAPSKKKARTMTFDSIGDAAAADHMASIMGHFDLNTLRGGEETTTATLVPCCGSGADGDESTMKQMVMTMTAQTTGAVAVAAAVKPTAVRGPTDFRDLVVSKKESQQSVEGAAGKVPKHEVPSAAEGEWVEVKKRPKLEAKKRGRAKK